MLRIFVCVLLLLLAFVVGCEKTTEQASDGIHLIAWECFTPEEHKVFLQLIEKFEKQYFEKTGKKLSIEARKVPYDDFATNLKLSALGGKTPDIACFDALKSLEFAYHKVLLPLDTLKNFDAASIADKKKHYMPGAFETNVVEIKGETHLYSLPQQMTCLALFWNRNMFRAKTKELQAAGLDPKAPPTTWDELIAYGKVITDAEEKRYGFAMKNTLWFTMPFFGCYQSSYITTDESGKKTCNLGDPLSSAALQLKVDLYQKHKIEAGAWKAQATPPDVGFRNGYYAMVMTGPWNIKKFRQETGLDFGITLIPKISQQEAKRLGLISPNASQEEYQQKITSSTNVGGANIGIFRSCQHPEIAYEFINYISSKEAQIEWATKLFQIPVNLEAAKILQESPETDNDIKVFMKQAAYSSVPPRLPRYGYIELEIVNPEMELALRGQKSVQEALQNAARKINEKIIAHLEN